MPTLLTQDQARANLGDEDVARRLEAERLWRAHDEAHRACDAKFDELNATTQAEREAAYQVYLDTVEAIETRVDADAELIALRSAREAAFAAWDGFSDFKGELRTTRSFSDDNGELELCAVSGLVIGEDEDVVFTDGSYDGPALRGALGLAPLPVDDDEKGPRDGQLLSATA